MLPVFHKGLRASRLVGYGGQALHLLVGEALHGYVLVVSLGAAQHLNVGGHIDLVFTLSMLRRHELLLTAI